MMKRYLLLLSCFLLITSLAQAGKLKKNAGGTTTLNYLVGDGVTDNTTALQKAIDSCSKAGGGTLIIPKGTFVISPITMASNVNLYLDTLATLLGTPTMANYTVGGSLVNLIGGDSLHNVSITGKGTIDGNGAPWWAAYNANTSISRPRLVYLTKVLNLTISGITLVNSPSFHIVPNQCKNVYISGITINTVSTSPNTDGIDPSNCINVYITNCTIGDGDDNIAIKADRINGTQTIGTCQNINISNCTFLSGHGLSIGSETDDGVSGVTATNCTFNGTTNGIRIKSNIGLGGPVQNVKYSGMKMTNVENPIVINMAYSSKTGTYPTDTPSVNGFVIDSLTATGATGPAGSLVGLSGAYLKNITLSNVNISAKTGLVLTDATGVTLCNVVIKPTSGADIIATNVTYTTATTATITAASATTFCSGGSVVLNANTGTGYTYQWNNNGTAISGATAASYTATTAGTYTVTATSNYCPVTSAGVTVTVNPAPVAPTVTSPVTYCVGATATALTATGTALKWYTAATGGTGSTTAPTPGTTTAGTTDYYVTQTTNSCESPRAAIAVAVSASLAAPTVTSPVTYCQGATSTTLTATGAGLEWYTVATGGTASASAPTPSTTATGTTSYYVAQTSGTCQSSRATITVTVSAAPEAPTVASPVTYCQNATATALTATGTALTWYTVATGGTGTQTAPTPTTSTTGTTDYYVSQTVGCESQRALIAVTINTTPTAPTVTSPVSYCQNTTAAALTATGAALKWYTVATGGTASTTAPTPVTTVTGTTDYYVSQTSGACEGPRATIAVTVNTTPVAPTVASPVTYCQNTTAVALTATGTALTWYTTATGGTGSTTAPTPLTTTTGTTDYYVSQTIGCESPRAAIAVTVSATPAAPTVTSTVNYCQNATATALTATGTALEWYTAAAGGTGNTTAPTPITTTTGTTSYYVSQTVGCESPRATIAVTVNATPAAPTVSTPVYHCQGSTVAALTATGTALEWYTTATGGTGSATAPTPLTTSAGTTDYYVSQTTGGCESSRATIAVTINASPTVTITAATSTSFCTGDSVVLSVNTGTGLTYQWNNGGTAVTGATSASYTVSSAGNYAAKVTNSAKCSATSTAMTVSVSTPPSVSNAGSVQYITTTTATLGANTPATGTGTWSVVSGAGTFTNASSATTSVTGLSAGANVLQWTISNGACPASSSSVTINISASPTVQTINGPPQITTNASGVIYSLPDNSGSTYHWSLPSGVIITSANADSSSITTSFGATGGTIYVTETDPYGQATSSLVVTVGNAPVQQIINGKAYVTPNETGVAYSVPDDNGSTYHWILPSGALITSANADSSQITISYGTAGGNLTVTETNPYGSATSILSVAVGNAPTTKTITGLDTITANSTGITYSVPDSAGSTYHWTLPQGATITSANADSSSITVSFGTTGGTVSVTETNPYGSASSTLPVAVGSAPTTQTITGPDSVTTNEVGVVYSVPGSAGSTYHWSLPLGATIASATNDSSSIIVSFGTTGGTVSVTQTDPYGSATSTLPVGISSATAVIAGATTNTYEANPNPFSDYTTITIHSSVSEQIMLTVVTIQGVVCYSSSEYYTNQQFNLGSELSADGVYFVQLAYGGGVSTIKLVRVR